MDYGFTYNEIFSAFEDCLRNKKSTKGAKEFCMNKVDNLIQLADDINNRTYTIGTSRAFVITDPKLREVFAADFRDRIVHHLVIHELEPYFEDYFIKNTFSCMKGRGTLHGVQCLESLIKERSNSYTIPYYIAKLDYKAFFMSIDKQLLCDRLLEFIRRVYPENRKKPYLIWLCELIILHHPEDNCTRVGNISLWGSLSFYKSLFKVGKDKGLAIGNLTSQMFANFYLTPVDYYIIYKLKLDLVRYADDFVVGHYDLSYLKKCIPLIKEFALREVKLTIHPDKLYIQECHKGITFIGGVVRPNRIYCSNRAVGKLFSKAATKFPEYSKEDIEDFISSMNSYLGLMKHYKTYKIRKKFIKKYIKSWLPHIVVGKNYYKINKR